MLSKLFDNIKQFIYEDCVDQFIVQSSSVTQTNCITEVLIVNCIPLIQSIFAWREEQLLFASN